MCKTGRPIDCTGRSGADFLLNAALIDITNLSACVLQPMCSALNVFTADASVGIVFALSAKDPPQQLISCLFIRSHLFYMHTIFFSGSPSCFAARRLCVYYTCFACTAQVSFLGIQSSFCRLSKRILRCIYKHIINQSLYIDSFTC